MIFVDLTYHRDSGGAGRISLKQKVLARNWKKFSDLHRKLCLPKQNLLASIERNSQICIENYVCQHPYRSRESIYKSILCYRLNEISRSEQKIYLPHHPSWWWGWWGQCVIFLLLVTGWNVKIYRKVVLCVGQLHPGVGRGKGLIYKDIILLGTEWHIQMYTEKFCILFCNVINGKR